MSDRPSILQAAHAKGRVSWHDYLDLQHQKVHGLYRGLTDDFTLAAGRHEKSGKLGPHASAPLHGHIKTAIPPFRKSLGSLLKRGIANSIDQALRTAIQAALAAGVDPKDANIGTSFTGKDGVLLRYNAMEDAMPDSAWAEISQDALDAVSRWNLSQDGLSLSDRVWDVSYSAQKTLWRALMDALAKGTSAADLSRTVRNLLVMPDTLTGDTLKNYHPGVGVYKSAYKNALRLTATELNTAFVQGTYAYGDSKDWIDGYIWRIGNVNACEECLPHNGEFFPKDDPPEIPAHPWCLPAGVVVRPCGDLLGATWRQYRGEMVTVETATHKKLTCTPNHPILTPHGWVAAGGLHVGEDVSCCDQLHGRVTDLHDIHEPACVEDAVQAFRESCNVCSDPVAVAREDFHGDGGSSEIAVVSTYGLLRDRLYSKIEQVLAQVRLVLREITGVSLDGLGSLAFTFPHPMRATHGRMGCLSPKPFALWGAMPHGQRSGLIIAAWGDSVPPEAFDDGPAVDIETFGQGIDGLSRAIERDEFFFRERLALSRRDEGIGFRVGPQRASSFDDPPANGRVTDAKVFRNTAGRLTPRVPLQDGGDGKLDGDAAEIALAGGFVLEKIIHVHSSQFRGSVYNLMTSKTFYLANGFLSSNCFCYPETHIEGDPGGPPPV